VGQCPEYQQRAEHQLVEPAVDIELSRPVPPVVQGECESGFGVVWLGAFRPRREPSELPVRSLPRGHRELSDQSRGAAALDRVRAGPLLKLGAPQRVAREQQRVRAGQAQERWSSVGGVVHATEPRRGSGVVEAHPQVVLYAYRAVDALHASDQVCPMVAGRQEVDDAGRASGGPPGGLQNERLREVAALHDPAVDDGQLPPAVVGATEKSGEQGG